MLGKVPQAWVAERPDQGTSETSSADRDSCRPVGFHGLHRQEISPWHLRPPAGTAQEGSQPIHRCNVPATLRGCFSDFTVYIFDRYRAGRRSPDSGVGGTRGGLSPFNAPTIVS